MSRQDQEPFFTIYEEVINPMVLADITPYIIDKFGDTAGKHITDYIITRNQALRATNKDEQQNSQTIGQTEITTVSDVIVCNSSAHKKFLLSPEGHEALKRMFGIGD